jgi:hypothetical protein
MIMAAIGCAAFTPGLCLDLTAWALVDALVGLFVATSIRRLDFSALLETCTIA